MLTRSFTVTHSDTLLTDVVSFFEVEGRGVGGAVQQKKKKKKAATTKKNEDMCGWGGGGGGIKKKWIIHQLQLIRQTILLP